MKITSGANGLQMKLFRPWIITGAILMIGIFFLLSANAAHAQGFTADITIESAIVNPQTGQATVSGSLICSEPTTTTFLNFEMFQITGNGRFTQGNIAFSSDSFLRCDESGAPYTLFFVGFPEGLKVGTAEISAFFEACNAFTCVFKNTSRSLRLEPSK